MKTLKYLLCFWILSCTSKEEKKRSVENVSNSTIRKIILKDSLGGLTLEVPDRYDTMFSWVHSSDCGAPCNTRKIRFQPKRFPIVRESGVMWTELTDSLDRLTISYPEEIRLIAEPPELSQVKYSHASNIIQFKTDYPDFSVKFDTIKFNHDKYYSFVALEAEGSAKRKMISASVKILGNEVNFCYEAAKGSVSDSVYVEFIKNAISLLSTIKTEK